MRVSCLLYQLKLFGNVIRFPERYKPDPKENFGPLEHVSDFFCIFPPKNNDVLKFLEKEVYLLLEKIAIIIHAM